MANPWQVWLRWATVHGAPRLSLSARARRGEPLARFILGRGDPLESIEQIRRGGPLVRTPLVWVSADHEVCRTILRDNDFGVSDPSEMGLPPLLQKIARRSDPGLPNPVEPPSMLMTDPPRHTEYRRLVARSFAPRSIASLEARIGEITAELLDDLDRRDEVDLIADFASQLPAAVITEMLGVPAHHRSRILGWANTASPLLDIGIPWASFRAAIDSLAQIDDFLDEHFRDLRIHGADGSPFSKLAIDGELSGRELRSNAALLVGAGVETTVNLIGNGIAALLDHPDQVAMLLADPDLWPGAVEEMLRYDSPVQVTARTALRDTEVAGTAVSAGEVAVLLLGGANRDPKVFDRPDRFDITRANAREHLAFASGIHVCLGAALARFEGATALRELFTRFPDLHLSAPAQHRGLMNLNGYRRMPSRLRHEAAASPQAS